MLNPPIHPTPYADYGPERLYAFIARHGVEKPRDTSFVYSNLGVALLGQILAVRARKSYADQLREEIAGPLGMTDTVVQLSGEQQRRFLQGRDDKHRPVHALELGALAGAGAIRSTAGDMITYLEANLHPENIRRSRPRLSRLISCAKVRPPVRSPWRGFTEAIAEPGTMSAQRP